MDAPRRVLSIWMACVLWIGGVFNVLAGLSMFTLFHEGYRMLGMHRPPLILPVQIMGILVALFGVGYLMVAVSPLLNRNILLLGLLSKALAATTALWYVAFGPLGLGFAVVVFFADVIYVPLFWLIYRHLCRVAAGAAT